MRQRKNKRVNVGIAVAATIAVLGVATMVFGSFWIGLVALVTGLAVLAVVSMTHRELT
jgi:CHASE2 domain-containing sensor protein